MNNRKLFKPLDFIVLVGIILICMVIIYCINGNNKSVIAEISYDGEVVEIIDLSQSDDKIITITNGVKFEISNNRIKFIDVNCLDKLCENIGYVSMPSEVAICMPNKTVLKIRNKDDIDIIVL